MERHLENNKLTINDVDTLEGLEKNIVDLKSFDEVCIFRKFLFREKAIRLKTFVINGLFILDEFGQVAKLTDYIKTDDYKIFKKVEHFKDFKDSVSRYQYEFGNIPSSNDQKY